jgi:hypothetical protein
MVFVKTDGWYVVLIISLSKRNSPVFVCRAPPVRHILQKTSVLASIILAENQEAVLRLLHSSHRVEAILMC